MTLSVPATNQPHLSPEQKLWAAVLFQALRDAVFVDPNPHGNPLRTLANGVRRKHSLQSREEAAQWLLYDRRTFSIVCDFAGLNADYIRVKARRMIEAGDGGKSLPERFTPTDEESAEDPADVPVRRVRKRRLLRVRRQYSERDGKVAVPGALRGVAGGTGETG